ncbi:fumarylacetoacetate hydrolase family protein [Cohnella caldifontis]|uniref:fumarylacetoacetate hydrolase family protein n=1 Tax=Cohnella caldifontis TaxID=3027471 RepID=UPI0023EC1027|nr:fumarylacetoacetate hydrolase family protein [Cohnella sp. YIM B05605]
MKLLTFLQDGEYRLGVKTEQGVVDVTKARSMEASWENIPATLSGVIAAGAPALKSLRDRMASADLSVYTLDEDRLTFGPCLPNPGKIICVGLNYRKHAEETGADVPEYPILFNKFHNAVSAHGADVPLPKHASTKVDYEAELAIVIGKRTQDVSREQALDNVFGYCNANDLSARDLQVRTSQWLLGKSLDAFMPIGPYLVTADEIENPNALNIRCLVNGELRQNSNTSDMIFHCDEIISYLSKYMTLEPGDIILTGTPEGVVLGYPEAEQVYLKDGDTVTVEIEKLGVLRNRMVQ